MGVWMKVVIMAHQILSQEDAWIEATPHLRVDLLCIVHEFFEFFGKGDHALGESWQKFLNQVEILIELTTFDDDCFSFKIVEGYLEVDLFEFVYKSFSFLLFVEFHDEMQLQIIQTSK